MIHFAIVSIHRVSTHEVEMLVKEGKGGGKDAALRLQIPINKLTTT